MKRQTNQKRTRRRLVGDNVSLTFRLQPKLRTKKLKKKKGR